MTATFTTSHAAVVKALLTLEGVEQLLGYNTLPSPLLKSARQGRWDTQAYMRQNKLIYELLYTMYSKTTQYFYKINRMTVQISGIGPPPPPPPPILYVTCSDTLPSPQFAATPTCIYTHGYIRSAPTYLWLSYAYGLQTVNIACGMY